MNLVMCSTWIGLSHFLITVALPVFNVDINGSARYGLLENIFKYNYFRSLIDTAIDGFCFVLDTCEIYFMKQYFRRF
jgi:hypothetical protein